MLSVNKLKCLMVRGTKMLTNDQVWLTAEAAFLAHRRTLLPGHSWAHATELIKPR